MEARRPRRWPGRQSAARSELAASADSRESRSRCVHLLDAVVGGAHGDDVADFLRQLRELHLLVPADQTEPLRQDVKVLVKNRLQVSGKAVFEQPHASTRRPRPRSASDQGHDLGNIEKGCGSPMRFALRRRAPAGPTTCARASDRTRERAQSRIRGTGEGERAQNIQQVVGGLGLASAGWNAASRASSTWAVNAPSDSGCDSPPHPTRPLRSTDPATSNELGIRPRRRGEPERPSTSLSSTAAIRGPRRNDVAQTFQLAPSPRTTLRVVGPAACR